MYGNLELFIDGKWHGADGRKGEDVINPATEKPLAHLPHASQADLDQALAAATKGFAVWRATSAYDRCKILHKAADLMRERFDAISKIMVLEQGKTYPEARAEVITSPRASGYGLPCSSTMILEIASCRSRIRSAALCMILQRS